MYIVYVVHVAMHGGLLTGRVSNRLPWYYTVADRSSYMAGEIYTK